MYGVSAEHGIGVDDVQAAIAARMPEPSGAAPEGPAVREIALAVVGRPNVGKSSLVNALLGSERSIVSEIAGHDPRLRGRGARVEGHAFRLVDTAGIRRKGRTERGPEVLSVVQARRQIEQCDVVLLVLDANEGPTAQDATVASYANDAGKGLVLVANKWDLAGAAGRVRPPRRSPPGYRRRSRSPPMRPFSSCRRRPGAASPGSSTPRRGWPRTGRGGSRPRSLNRVLGRALRDKAPRTASGKSLRILYVAQTETTRRTFTLVANREERLHFSEERRIENLVREAADFAGSPIRIEVRQRSGEGRERERRTRK